ncbi:MAG: hypothetical protein KC503_40680 [Myxococcales bacterium]|nr:hypothetical protein [Myxococcales bacterium]
MRHLLYVVPVVLALWLADRVVSDDGRIGWERNGVFDGQRRVARSRARRIVLFGSSTSVDWLRPGHVAQILGGKPDDVLDAHVNGCHQACTLAQVKAMLARGRRRFQYAFFGTNQFQMCEFEHSKRVLQQVMNLPAADVPETFGIYLHAERPLNYIARFIGISLSETYGDTKILQSRWSRALFEPRRGAGWRWVLKKRPKRKNHWHLCPYEPAQVAYKAEMMRALLDSLGELSQRVFVNILPDINLSEREPKRRAKVALGWKRHRALMKKMCDARHNVTCFDLATERGARLPQHFRDGFHTSALGGQLQRALLIEQMRAGGFIRRPPHRPRPRPRPRPAPSRRPPELRRR